MILEPLFGLSLVLNASINLQSNAAAGLRPSTDCIVRKVFGLPRYSNDLRPEQINDLIVDSIAACVRPVRAMMDAHDRMYGPGSGEAFLLGPYLDILPAAVVGQLKAKAPDR
jgi:hypothetical protein